ncbi:MAG: 50S ribosomal protein L11 methyltransferase, partial [Firmicutes bacterium]|nr:50S ribosomal protein L11 methyltransferase [Bacillota bacterium]
MNYKKLTIKAPKIWEEALTMVLYAHNAPGLEIEDPSIIAEHLAKGDWDASVFDGQVIETGVVALHALFPVHIPLKALYEDIAALCPQHTEIFEITSIALPELDWQQVWREFFPVLYIGRSLLIKPYWSTKSIIAERKAVLISPGQAFGTGDHATTALALELLEKQPLLSRKLLDIGCGSGILAIAAIKLGAAQALAADNDPLCARSVAEHRLLSNIAEETLPFLAGDILQDVSLQNACRIF